MPLELETFVKQLTDSGILTAGKLEDFVPPKASPKDAEELADELVKAGNLTQFQARRVLAGEVRSLILGNYTLVDKIGEGGMGQVFKAEHRRMHRLVAIKKLPPAMTSDPGALARFEREVTAAAKLSHTHIVAAYDADEADGAHFLVMEFVEGRDLSALVKANGPFPPSQAVAYILQAARGLEFAHAKGVVHRDIKPANLLLSNDGMVKILDMGLARIETPGEAQAELTNSGTIMGTVDYMAPEQGMSTKHADARADIYSLGCSLHYLLTGKPAYAGETVAAKLVAHHTSPIPSLRKVVPELPDVVDKVFSKMIAKQVDDRYQSMTEVVAGLEKCQQALATGSTTVWRPSKTIRSPGGLGPAPETRPLLRRPAVIGLVAAGVLGAAVLLGVMFKLKTSEGTLVVEVDQADASVEISDDQNHVEITRKSEKGPITIDVERGKHRVKIAKDGFETFGQEVELRSGGNVIVKATLTPTPKAGVATNPLLPPGEGGRRPDEGGSKAAPSPNTGPLAASTPAPRPSPIKGEGEVAPKPSPLVLAKRPLLEFDGVKSHIETPNWKYTGDSSLTAEAWALSTGPRDARDENTNTQGLFGDPDNAGFYLFKGAVWDFELHDGDTYRIIAQRGSTPMGDAVHVAGVYDRERGELRLYLNGKLHSQTSFKGNYMPSPNTTFMIGANANGRVAAQEFFAGQISEVRMSKIARYRGDFTPEARPASDADTILLYHLDEGAGEVAHDASGHGYDGRIVSCAWRANELALAGRPPTPLAPLVLPAEMKTARQLADWTIGAGGSVALDKQRYYRVADLPARLDKLDHVNLSGLAAVDDHVAAAIATWAPLPMNLDLSNTSITDAGLRSFGKPSKGWSYFNVSGTAITGEGFDAFHGDWGGFRVSRCRFTKEGLKQIAGLVRPTKFHAADCGLDDAALAELAKIKEITGVLVLADNPFGDAGLVSLERHKGLKELDLKGTLVTAAGVARLQKALPSCKIEWDDPAKTISPSPASSPAPSLAPRPSPIKGEGGLAFKDPAFQQWMKTVAALPVDKQSAAVAAKLKE